MYKISIIPTKSHTPPGQKVGREISVESARSPQRKTLEFQFQRRTRRFSNVAGESRLFNRLESRRGSFHLGIIILLPCTAAKK